MWSPVPEGQWLLAQGGEGSLVPQAAVSESLPITAAIDAAVTRVLGAEGEHIACLVGKPCMPQACMEAFLS